MPRDVSDPDGRTWNCIQAFAGLGGEAEDLAGRIGAARVGDGDRVYVVCTPSGGAHSVRVELPTDWETTLSDADLLQAIRAKLAEDA